MTASELITRARSAIGKGIAYKLGKGGFDQHYPTPSRPSGDNNSCDCSGYACWCLGISRVTTHPLYVKFNGGWINTDAIVHDASNLTGFFEPWDTRLSGPPIPGCIIVYASRKGGPKVGHVGIVTEVADGRVSKVIHCSSGNYRKTGDAIQETGPEVFLKQPHTILCWYGGVER